MLYHDCITHIYLIVFYVLFVFLFTLVENIMVQRSINQYIIYDI